MQLHVSVFRVSFTLKPTCIHKLIYILHVVGDLYSYNWYLCSNIPSHISDYEVSLLIQYIGLQGIPTHISSYRVSLLVYLTTGYPLSYI